MQGRRATLVDWIEAAPDNKLNDRSPQTSPPGVKIFIVFPSASPARMGFCISVQQGSMICFGLRLLGDFQPRFGHVALCYVVGVLLLSRFDRAVINCAGANGFDSITLFGTPFEVQSAASAPLM